MEKIDLTVSDSFRNQKKTIWMTAFMLYHFSYDEGATKPAPKEVLTNQQC